MMAAVREWLTSVVVVTMLLSVAQMLLPEGTPKKIASFIGGLILVATILRPLPGMDLKKLGLESEVYTQAVEERREELEAAGKEEMAGLIESRTAAYISEQAMRMGMDVDVSVHTETRENGYPVPTEVELTGQRSEKLAEWIEREMGIPGERQVWNGEN